VLKVEDKYLESAANLISILPEHALRTLDALHLAIAQHHGLQLIATADKLLASAAEALGLEWIFLIYSMFKMIYLNESLFLTSQRSLDGVKRNPG